MATGLRIDRERDSHVWRWVFGSIIVLLLASSAWFGFRYYTTGEPLPVPIALASANPDVDEAEVSDTDKEAHTVAANAPRYVSIPSLDIVDARVLGMGTKENGELDTPSNTLFPDGKSSP